MRQKVFLALIIIGIFGVSCNTRQNPFPEKITKRIEPAESSENLYTIKSTNSDPEIWDDLNLSLNFYFQHSAEFNPVKLENEWHVLHQQNRQADLDSIDLLNWAKTTGLLFELTGAAEYADELENLYARMPGNKDFFDAFVFTRYVDHIHVNLFENQEINYTHSLGGQVTITQETKAGKAGGVKIHFSMTERRYIELYVRIPAWSSEATVTVKKVKYFTEPGSYCKIAKKWKDGDLVEIDFPNKP